MVGEHVRVEDALERDAAEQHDVRVDEHEARADQVRTSHEVVWELDMCGHTQYMCKICTIFCMCE